MTSNKHQQKSFFNKSSLGEDLKNQPQSKDVEIYLRNKGIVNKVFYSKILKFASKNSKFDTYNFIKKEQN